LPGVSHEVVVPWDLDDVDVEVAVAVGRGTVGEVTGTVVVVLSLHPNQPGVLHVVVVVDVVVELVDVLVPVVVVVSSRQPHQPGVLHVSVRVRVLVELDELDEVVVSVPLLSYIFQFAQSRHSGVNLHSGTVSYFIRTSWITTTILWVPMPTRQPLSATTS
jgi:hypothetical protein